MKFTLSPSIIIAIFLMFICRFRFSVTCMAFEETGLHLEVPERAGGAGVCSFSQFIPETCIIPCVYSLVFFLILCYYLTSWYSPWRWWALSFFSLICLIWPSFIYTYFCYYLYAYHYISICEKHDFELKIWVFVWTWIITQHAVFHHYHALSNLHSSKCSSSIP